MKHIFVHALLTGVLLAGTSGCDAQTMLNARKPGKMPIDKPSAPPTREAQSVGTLTGDASSNDTVKAVARSGLPHSQGRIFYNLDDYLAHLVVMGHQDRPFYVKVGPDRYRLNSGRGSRGARGGRGKPGRGGKASKSYTRADLMRKFGFSK